VHEEVGDVPLVVLHSHVETPVEDHLNQQDVIFVAKIFKQPNRNFSVFGEEIATHSLYYLYYHLYDRSEQ